MGGGDLTPRVKGRVERGTLLASFGGSIRGLLWSGSGGFGKIATSRWSDKSSIFAIGVGPITSFESRMVG